MTFSGLYSISWTIWTLQMIWLYNHTTMNRWLMHAKTTALQTTALKIGLNINTEKTKKMRINNSRTEPIRLGTPWDRGCYIIHLLWQHSGHIWGYGSGHQNQDRKSPESEYSSAKIWNSRELSRSTKIRIFNSNVKAVLFYGKETWRTNVSSAKRVQ